MDFELKIKIISPLIGKYVDIPSYATTGSAGLDLRACIENSISLGIKEKIGIPTGIAIQLPSSFMAGFIFPRSGLATKYGINLANGVGVIDSDYTGEIICVIQNTGKESYIIKPGDRIAQLVFLPIARAHLVFVEQLLPTERGQGGFGSSGIN